MGDVSSSVAWLSIFHRTVFHFIVYLKDRPVGFGDFRVRKFSGPNIVLGGEGVGIGRVGRGKGRKGEDRMG